jgi:predicted Fe-Mo cluster-binding NifX family protein
MKFAIASDDGRKIASHFGRTRGFVIFETNGSDIVDRSYIENTFTGHAIGANHTHGHGHAEGAHNRIITALSGCEAVVAHGMGRRIYVDLMQNNIKPYITQETDVDKAAGLMMQHALDDDPGRGCQHTH